MRPAMLNHDAKSKGGIAFRLKFPIIIQLSLPTKTIKALRENFPKTKKGQCEDANSISQKFRKKYLKFFNVKNETELVKNNPNIRRNQRELARLLREEMRADPEEYRRVFREWAQELLNEKK